MRPVTVNPNNTLTSLNELGQASHENDVVDIAQNFNMIGTLTQTTDLNLSSPTVANCAAVLGTLLEIMQKGGINRTT
jgi:dihydroorotate dehydrogenase